MIKVKCILLFFFIFSFLNSGRATEITVEKYVDKGQLNVPAVTDLHITGKENVLVNTVVNLTAESSWLFFDNLKPSVVGLNYKDKILINGKPFDYDGGTNARIAIYAQGSVVIPHPLNYQPLEVFTEPLFKGNSRKYSLNVYNNNLGNFDNKIRSFKLKRGYMATMANESDGTGYSRVFIADKQDLLISNISKELDESVSFIRVFKWEWVSKKGWCQTGNRNGGSPVENALKTNSTWLYTWSADGNSTKDIEYVPIHAKRYWPSYSQINEKEQVTHLMGYNEPDHSEQQDGTMIPVSEAVADWPNMMKSGLRIGSPATTDFNWLYSFMDECKKRDYRVDFVVVHAYWASMTPQQWYDALKTVYTKTGRPIWIKEWNNGANWTTETWPSSWSEQMTKQYNDIKGILQVLDTAHFIERYSIYNWVEAKRSVINDDNAFTPMGIYYRDNCPSIAFRRTNEVIPQWTQSNTPAVLSYKIPESGRGVNLVWTDTNGDMARGAIVQRSVRDSIFVEIARTGKDIRSYEDKDAPVNTNIKYRIYQLSYTGAQIVSNTIELSLATGTKNFQFGKLSLNHNNWTKYSFPFPDEKVPVIIFGTPTYNNILPYSNRVKILTPLSFMFHLDPWSYLISPLFPKNDDINYLVIPEGEYDWDGIKAKAGVAEKVSDVWTVINFPHLFEEVPVVFATQVTSKTDFATTVRIRNVSKSGFEIKLQKEEAKVNAYIPRENVCYLAVTPGSGNWQGQKIKIGKTGENVVGNLHFPTEVLFGETVDNPGFFAAMQTCNDDVAATLRMEGLTKERVNIFKQREVSTGVSALAMEKETAGWMVVEFTPNANTSITSPYMETWNVYPNPLKDIVYITNSDKNTEFQVQVFDLSGRKLIDRDCSGSLNLKELPAGNYILKINNQYTYQLMKE